MGSTRFSRTRNPPCTSVRYVTLAPTSISRYVRMARFRNQSIGRGPGDALQLLAFANCDARIINLETSITTSDDYVSGKAVHYRMNPANSEALSAVRPDVCVLANNHVLDFGRRGLLETLDVLSASGLATVGAGRSYARLSRR